MANGLADLVSQPAFASARQLAAALGGHLDNPALRSHGFYQPPEVAIAPSVALPGSLGDRHVAPQGSGVL
jgi:hypothetical protein